MKISSTPDNHILHRLQQLYESSKSSGMTPQKKKLHDQNMPPYIQKKSNNLNSNQVFESNSDTSFYEKYSKIWLKTSTSVSSIKIFLLTISKNHKKVLGLAFRKFSKTISDPLAFTMCPKCNHIGLSLLTTSTKNNLSPRFLDKIRGILPSSSHKHKEINKNISRDHEKSIINNHSPIIDRKNSERNSLVLYSEDQILYSPEKKIPISDISDIKPNPYFLSSLSSPENFQKSLGENRICKPKAEVSFDISKDSNDFFRENLNFQNLPKQIVPKLNFNEIFVDNIATFGRKKSNLNFLNIIIKERMKYAFEKLYRFDCEASFALSEKSKTQIINTVYRERNNNPKLCNIQKKIISNSKKTAFKILNSRLEKFIFRRKMQGFYYISEFLYR